jgi:hypothetical protein
MLASLEERTGKNMQQWLAIVKRAKAEDPAEIRALLKTRGLGASTIGLIVDQAAGKSPDTYEPQQLVAEMFKGPKASLTPLYDSVLHFTLELGTDVKACPCATIVPFYRQHVFAQIKPATKTRLDLGLALGNLKAFNAESKNLIETGGLARKDRITHRLEVAAPSDFNQFAKDWLLRAYEADE